MQEKISTTDDGPTGTEPTDLDHQNFRKLRRLRDEAGGKPIAPGVSPTALDRLLLLATLAGMADE